MPVLPKHATDVEHFLRCDARQAARLRPLCGRTTSRPAPALVLHRDPDYWGADLPSQRGFYNFDEIDIQYFRDGNSLFEAFKAGLARLSRRDQHDALGDAATTSRPLRDGRSWSRRR